LTSAPRLRLQLGSSRRLAAGIVGAHAAAGLCAGVPWAPRSLAAAIFLLFLLLGTLLAWRIALLGANRSPAQVELGPDGGCELTLRNGTQVRIAPGARHVTRYWVALPCDMLPGGALLVVGGMLAPDDFRRLRLWALWIRGSDRRRPPSPV